MSSHTSRSGLGLQAAEGLWDSSVSKPYYQAVTFLTLFLLTLHIPCCICFALGRWKHKVLKSGRLKSKADRNARGGSVLLGEQRGEEDRRDRERLNEEDRKEYEKRMEGGGKERRKKVKNMKAKKEERKERREEGRIERKE